MSEQQECAHHDQNKAGLVLIYPAAIQDLFAIAAVLGVAAIQWFTRGEVRVARG